MSELKGAIISGLRKLGFGNSYIERLVTIAHLEEQRQISQTPNGPVNVPISIGSFDYSLTLIIRPDSRASLEVKLLRPNQTAICTLARRDGNYILSFRDREYVVDPSEAVQEFLAKATGKFTRYDFLQEEY